MLLGAGALAALAVAAFPLQLRIPGHAILRGSLPIVAGMAIVPRRMAGSVMTVGALAAAMGLSSAGLGNWQPAQVTGVFALGPAIDLAMLGLASRGWWVYLRLVLAGVLANSMAFAVRYGMFLFEVDATRPHRLNQFGPNVYFSYVLCGALAGMLGAAVCFRFSSRTR